MSCSPHRQQQHHHRRPPPPVTSSAASQSASSYRPSPSGRDYRRYRSPPPQRVSSTYRPGYSSRRPLTPPLASHRSGSPSPGTSTYTAPNGKSAYQRYPPSVQQSRPPSASASSYDRQARPYRAAPAPPPRETRERERDRDREERRGPVTPPLPGRHLPLAQRISGPPKSTSHANSGPTVKSEPVADDGGLPYGDDSDQDLPHPPKSGRKESRPEVQDVKREASVSAAELDKSAPEVPQVQRQPPKQTSTKPTTGKAAQEAAPEPQPPSAAAQQHQPEPSTHDQHAHRSAEALAESPGPPQADLRPSTEMQESKQEPLSEEQDKPLRGQDDAALEKQQGPSSKEQQLSPAKPESLPEQQQQHPSPERHEPPAPEKQDQLPEQPGPSPQGRVPLLDKQDASTVQQTQPTEQPDQPPVAREASPEKQDPSQQRPHSPTEKQDPVSERQHLLSEQPNSSPEKRDLSPEKQPSLPEKRDLSPEKQPSLPEKPDASPDREEPSPEKQDPQPLTHESCAAPEPPQPSSRANGDAPASPAKQEPADPQPPPPPTDMAVDDDPIQLLTAISNAAPMPVSASVDSTTSQQHVNMAPPFTDGDDVIVLAEMPKGQQQKAPQTFDEVLQHVSQTAQKAQDPEEALIHAFYQTLPSPQSLSEPREAESESALPPKKRPKLNGSVPSRPCAITYHLPLAYRETHDILRPALEANLEAQNAKRQVHIDHLRDRYLKLHFAWKVHCERMERIKAAHDRTPLPPGTPFTSLEQIGWGQPEHANGSHSDGFPFPSSSGAGGGGGPGASSGGDVLASPQGPPGSAATPSALSAGGGGGGGGSVRQSRRTGGSGLATNSHGDAVLSEAQFQEVLAQLDLKERLDPASRAAKSAAIVPDMLAPDDAQRFVASFDNHNAQVDDVEEYYGISQPATSRADPCATEWNDEEVKTFLRRFAQHPKQFGKIAQDLPDKTIGQCVLFYYRSKRTIDFRSLVERKYAGGRKKKLKTLSSKGSSSLLSEVQERSKTKGKRKSGAENNDGGDDDANSTNSPKSPPATPSAAGSTSQPTTFYNKKMLSQPIDNIGLGAQATQNVFHGSSKRAEMEAARAKRSKPASAPALPQPEPVAEPAPDHPPSDSQQMAAEALAMLTGSLTSASSIHNTSNSHDTDMDGGEYLPSVSSNSRGGSNSLKSSTNSRLNASGGGAANGDPGIKGKRRLHSSSYWSVQEKQDFLRLLAVHGKHWHSISAQITNKTPVQCRNYFANHHVKLGLDDIAARATGDVSMIQDSESVPGTPDGVKLEPRGLAAAPIAETSMDMMAPSPEQPKVSSRSNSSLQIRDLLNSADDNEDQTSGGGQTPGAAHDWFGNDNEEPEEEGPEEGEEASDTHPSVDTPLPPPHVMYARPPPSAPPTGYFSAPPPMDPYGRSMPPMSAGMPYPPPGPWGHQTYSMPVMPPPAPAQSTYMRPPTMQQQDMPAYDRNQRGSIEREGDSRYYHSSDRFAPPPPPPGSSGPLSAFPRRPFPPPPASYPDYNSRFR